MGGASSDDLRGRLRRRKRIEEEVHLLDDSKRKALFEAAWEAHKAVKGTALGDHCLTLAAAIAQYERTNR